MNLKKKEFYLVTGIISVLLVKLIFSFGFNVKGHTVWHSLHAGLLEPGGCVSKTGDSYPLIYYDLDKLKNDELSCCSNNWNDVFEYIAAKNSGAAEPFTDAYDEVLKNQTINLVKKFPQETMNFLVMRFFIILSFSHFKTHTVLGSARESSMLYLVESLFFLMILALWLRSEADNDKKVFYIGLLIFALLPPLLVHSKHLIYNINANLIQLLIMTTFSKKRL